MVEWLLIIGAVMALDLISVWLDKRQGRVHIHTDYHAGAAFRIGHYLEPKDKKDWKAWRKMRKAKGLSTDPEIYYGLKRDPDEVQD